MMKIKFEVLDSKGHLSPAGEIHGFSKRTEAVAFASRLAALSGENEYVEILDKDGNWPDNFNSIEVKPVSRDQANNVLNNYFFGEK